MKRETTRVREQGTIVTMPCEFNDPGIARINAIHQVVTDKQYAKIDGIMVDLFSASTIMAVYNAINETNQAKFRNMPVARMASVAFKVMK